jgi:hypothetical protein
VKVTQGARVTGWLPFVPARRTFGHRIHQSRERVTAVAAEDLRNSALALQHWHVDIEIHPIDALQLEGHVTIEDIGDVLWSTHGGSGTPAVPHGRPEPFPGLSLMPLLHGTSRRSEAEPR